MGIPKPEAHYSIDDYTRKRPRALAAGFPAHRRTDGRHQPALQQGRRLRQQPAYLRHAEHGQRPQDLGLRPVGARARPREPVPCQHRRAADLRAPAIRRKTAWRWRCARSRTFCGQASVRSTDAAALGRQDHEHARHARLSAACGCRRAGAREPAALRSAGRCRRRRPDRSAANTLPRRRRLRRLPHRARRQGHGRRPAAADADRRDHCRPTSRRRRTHGIGNYTLEQFDAALRKGVRADGKHLYPAMPYTSYALAHGRRRRRRCTPIS